MVYTVVSKNEIYIDQLFVENILIFVLLLKVCGKLMNITMSWKRIWLTSGIGAAALCAVIFFRPEKGWMRDIMAALVPIVLTAMLGLGIRGWRMVLRSFFFLLIATALFAGIFQIIFFIWEPPVLLAAALTYTVIDILIGRQRQRMALEEYRAEITLEDQGGRWKLTGLIDTGNHLTEPLTGRPVSILDWQEAEKIERFCQILKEENGYLYIPYHAIGTEHGWLMGIVIDAMRINYKGEEIRILHPVLAVSREKLSTDGRYQIIINPLHAMQQKEKWQG